MQLAPLILASAFALGCTQHRGAVTMVPAGRSVEIVVDGAELSARAVAGPNGTAFQTEAGQLIPAERVIAARDVDHVWGLLEGLAIGAGVGVVVGVVSGFASGDDPEGTGHEWFEPQTAREKAFGGGVLLGILGGGIGALVGVVRGQTDVWQRPAPIVLQGPPGSTAGITIRF